MNLNKIAEIIARGLQAPESNWRGRLFEEIAKDTDAIPSILAILDAERTDKNKLVTDLNALLSQADVILEEPKLNSDNFFQKRLKEFYHSGRINHCFKPIEPPSK